MTMATPGTPPAKLSQRMSSQDASFIYGESNSGPLHIGTLNIFDGPIDYDEVVEHMAQRMHLLQRYRQKLTFVPFNLAHATLEDDPDFDLHNHVKRHSLPAGTELLTAALDLRAEASPPPPREQAWEPPPLPSPFRTLTNALIDLVQNR